MLKQHPGTTGHMGYTADGRNLAWDVKNIVNNGINYLPINSINSTSVVSARVGGSRHQSTYRGFVSTHTNYFSKHYIYIYHKPSFS